MDIDELRKLLEITEDINEVQRLLEENGFPSYKPSTPQERINKWNESETHEPQQLRGHANDYAEINDFEKALEIAKSINNDDIRKETLFNIASKLISMNKIEEGREILTKEATNINLYESFLNKIWTLFELAEKYFEMYEIKKFESILIEIEELVNEVNDDDMHKCKFYDDLAIIRYKFNQKQAAMDYWERGLLLGFEIVNTYKKDDQISFAYYEDIIGIIVNIARIGEFKKAESYISKILSNHGRKQAKSLIKAVKNGEINKL
jgi:tetratricopeptide (TPR) repeat protein